MSSSSASPRSVIAPVYLTIRDRAAGRITDEVDGVSAPCGRGEYSLRSWWQGDCSLRSRWQGGRKNDSPSPCDPATLPPITRPAPRARGGPPPSPPPRSGPEG